MQDDLRGVFRKEHEHMPVPFESTVQNIHADMVSRMHPSASATASRRHRRLGRANVIKPRVMQAPMKLLKLACFCCKVKQRRRTP